MAIYNNDTVTIQSGDTLYSIANKCYKQYGYSNAKSYQDYLVKINNIANPNMIWPGDVYKLTDSATTGGTSTKTTSATRVTIVKGPVLLSGSTDTLYIQWEWDKHSTTEKYELVWYRSWDLQGVALKEEQTTTNKYATYTVPSEVVNSSTGKVSVTIRPIAKKTTDSKGNESTPWTASWSTIDEQKGIAFYTFGSSTPSDTPSAPSVKIEDFKLTAELDDVPDHIEQVEFEVVKDNSATTYKSSGPLNVVSNYVSYSCDIESGGTYKVRCRYYNGGTPGAWSPWSSNSGTKPNAPSGFAVCRARDETSVYLEWNAVENATSYEIGYATEREFFNGSNDVNTATTKLTTHILTGLSSGDEYFFALKSINDVGESDWSSISSVVIGTEPSAPTTWSSLSKVVVGETFTLYWVHNSEDSSTQSKANIELIINGNTNSVEIDTSAEEDDEKTTYYPVKTTVDGDTSITSTGATIKVVEGESILWRVRTAGATGVYGDWSVQRTIDIYAKPTISINVMDTSDSVISTVYQFPIYIKGSSGPKAQTPVGYHLSIVSDSYYETVDNIGIRKVVNAGEEIYSEYLDDSSYTPSFKLSANNIDLENNVTYTVTCTVSMDSGLSGEDTRTFTVAWTDEQYEPNAEITLNRDTITTVIRPYCKDFDGNLIENVSLSVYRREFDGSFTELMTGIDNLKNTYVTDPHPALDYARYRIVAISNATGAVSYYDMPGYKVGENSVVIQWDDYWTDFDVTNEHVYPTSSWTGSMLKLPGNIDVSDTHSPDVSLVKYVGRTHPVAYYGTQVGHTASWNVEIPKNDKETLYAIRRLAIWMGNVYVREPSGTGYWANITVSYNQTHLETVIPITFNVKRVSGGA